MAVPKVIFIDLDNTLLYKGKVVKSAIPALKLAKDSGVLLFVATGRHKREIDIVPHIADIGFDGFVTLNGAICIVGDKVIYKKPMEKESVAAIIKYLEKNPFYCLFNSEDMVFVNMRNEIAENFQLSLGLEIPPVLDPQKALDMDIYQLVPADEASGNGLEFLRDLPNVSVTSWAKNCYDVGAEGINKWTGILQVINHLGIKPGEVAAIGDGENDIEMLREAGFSVVMGNGLDRVKKLADFITDDVDKNGMVNAVNYLLKEGIV